jgi:hypothetical protein
VFCHSHKVLGKRSGGKEDTMEGDRAMMMEKIVCTSVMPSLKETGMIAAITSSDRPTTQYDDERGKTQQLTWPVQKLSNGVIRLSSSALRAGVMQGDPCHSVDTMYKVRAAYSWQ